MNDETKVPRYDIQYTDYESSVLQPHEDGLVCKSHEVEKLEAALARVTEERDSIIKDSQAAGAAHVRARSETLADLARVTEERDEARAMAQKQREHALQHRTRAEAKTAERDGARKTINDAAFELPEGTDGDESIDYLLVEGVKRLKADLARVTAERETAHRLLYAYRQAAWRKPGITAEDRRLVADDEALAQEAGDE